MPVPIPDILSLDPCPTYCLQTQTRDSLWINDRLEASLSAPKAALLIEAVSRQEEQFSRMRPSTLLIEMNSLAILGSLGSEGARRCRSCESPREGQEFGGSRHTRLVHRQSLSWPPLDQHLVALSCLSLFHLRAREACLDLKCGGACGPRR
jgi:hypothetical protein